ncbi:MAG: hypothetical protein M5R40_03080 [Anaerolineae bacterium]|nr:hypothetical protein [Anaerolineae bacterium]
MGWRSTRRRRRTAGIFGAYAVGAAIPVQRTPDGKAFIAVRDLPPSETLILTNRPPAEAGAVRAGAGT